MALDFNKAAKSLLLDLINTKATRTLTEEELATVLANNVAEGFVKPEVAVVG